MCDYSLTNVKTRDAAVDDKLVTTNFGTGTIGFACADDPTVAVCIRPGTELAFEGQVIENRSYAYAPAYAPNGHTTARFRQVDKHLHYTHHDALEFPDGTITKLTMIQPGQKARVLQLPAAPQNEQEQKDQERMPWHERHIDMRNDSVPEYHG